MAYTKYHNPWHDQNVATDTPIIAAALDWFESGIAAAASTADSATTTANAAIPAPAGPASNDGLVWNGSSWTHAKLVDANIASGAAIGIAKLSGYPSDGAKVLLGDGTWGTPAASSSELDYVERTTARTVTATTEGSANAIVTGTSKAYDNSAKIVEFFAPATSTGVTSTTLNWVILRGATVLGQIDQYMSTSLGDVLTHFRVRDASPSAGTYTYSIQAFINASSTINVSSGSGGSGTLCPIYIRVTKA